MFQRSDVLQGEHEMITATVGVAGANHEGDVKIVQNLLNLFAAHLQIVPLVVDGDCGPATRTAILAFQQDIVGMEAPDGRIDPAGRTWRSLAAPVPAAASAPPAMGGQLATLVTAGLTTPLAEADFVAAAVALGCETNAIKTVAKVESSRAAFDELGRPTILYERHLFHRLTGGRFDSHPDLSNREAGGYGKFSAQYGKLERAYALDPEASLKACSWGMFQILGMNYKESGFAAVNEFVQAMCRTEAAHLNAFISFIKAHPGMQTALGARDWAGFARRYNGPAYHKNRYDERMAEAYRQLARP
jgi:hypothetical protein